MVLPIIAMSVYLYFYVPDVQSVITGAESNFKTSGGFGPNQVATILGLGIFCLFIRLFITHKTWVIRMLIYAILGFIIYRALVTLSRGGVITAAIMSFVFLISFLRYAKPVEQTKAFVKIIIVSLGLLVVWSISIIATNNMIYNRYTNRNANGDEQSSVTTGRIEIARSELKAFEEFPALGVGAGMVKYFRKRTEGIEVATHNEVTRLMSEHGILGFISILVLIAIPTTHFFKDKRNIFIIPMTLFWFLTISHSSMRIAAPGLIYGLALLKVKFDDTE